MKEVWKDIKDFSNYEISNLGRIKSKEKYDSINRLKPEIILKTRITTNGYEGVSLTKEGKRYNKEIHRLVAETFIPNPENYPVVNHKDEDKLNNKVDNLEWCTISYNNSYGTRLKRVSESQKGEKNHMYGKIPWNKGVRKNGCL